MTSNQSNQLIKNPNTKKAIAVLQKFATLEAEYKALEKQSKEAVEQIREAMIENGVTKIDGDWGYITLAERLSYKLDADTDIAEIPKEYLKQVLDTTKVKAEVTLRGVLPAGVVETRTQYITKKFKEVK